MATGLDLWAGLDYTTEIAVCVPPPFEAAPAWLGQLATMLTRTFRGLRAVAPPRIAAPYVPYVPEAQEAWPGGGPAVALLVRTP